MNRLHRGTPFSHLRKQAGTLPRPSPLPAMPLSSGTHCTDPAQVPKALRVAQHGLHVTPPLAQQVSLHRHLPPPPPHPPPHLTEKRNRGGCGAHRHRGPRSLFADAFGPAGPCLLSHL